MSSLNVALVSAGFIFSGALLGIYLRNQLPNHHLNVDSKDTVKLGAGLLATLAALILGLLVSSAKSTFDTMNSEIMLSASKLLYLDRVLADYGPETKTVRAQLRQLVAARIQMIWPERNESSAAGMAAFEHTPGLEQLQMELLELTPTNAAQRQMFPQAQQLCGELRETRWLVIEQAQNSLPAPFLVVLLFWLTALHMSFGLFAPRNATVILVLFICALSVSGAIFLILEMNHPLSGIIKVSSAPMLKVLELLGR